MISSVLLPCLRCLSRRPRNKADSSWNKSYITPLRTLILLAFFLAALVPNLSPKR